MLQHSSNAVLFISSTIVCLAGIHKRQTNHRLCDCNKCADTSTGGATDWYSRLQTVGFANIGSSALNVAAWPRREIYVSGSAFPETQNEAASRSGRADCIPPHSCRAETSHSESARGALHTAAEKMYSSLRFYAWRG